jgi:hypothetical protein
MQGAWKMTLPPAAQADWITADFEQEMQACRRGRLAWCCLEYICTPLTL